MIFNGREEIPHGTKRRTMEYLVKIIVTCFILVLFLCAIGVKFISNGKVQKGITYGFVLSISVLLLSLIGIVWLQ